MTDDLSSIGLNEEQRELAAMVRDFAEQVVAPQAYEADRSHTLNLDVVRQMGELGLFGLPFSEEYGGQGGDYLALGLAIEGLARVDQSIAITLEAGVSLGAMPIYRFGTEEQKQEYLPSLLAAEHLAAFGLTEPEAGSDAGASRTTARLEDGEWIIDGSKQPADAFLATQTGLDVYFLHLVRDPRGTVYSMLRRRDAASGFSVLLATVRGAGLWTARHAASRRVARTVAPDRTLVLRYEDLAGNPAQTLGRIADFVGVDAAAPAADGDAAIDVPVAHTPIGSGRFQAASLTVRPDEQWRESLSPMAGALTMALTLPVRLQLGHRARPR